MLSKTRNKSEYDIQAETFAEKIGLTMEVVYLGHYKRLSNYVTANWQVILRRGKNKPFTFEFSTSLNDSWRYFWEDGPNSFKHKQGLPPGLPESAYPKTSEHYTVAFGHKGRHRIEPTKQNPPTMYSVLAALTKYDPDTFENFCADYGYDEDSRKAFDVYLAVQKEWYEVRRIFHDVLEELQEIN